MTDQVITRIDYERLRIEQYKALRKEVPSLAAATRRVETYIIGATGALYAYFSTNSPQGRVWVWYVPVLFVLLGIWRSMRLFKRWNAIYRHIRQIEIEANLPSWKTDVGQEAELTTGAKSGKWGRSIDWAKKKLDLPWTAIALWVTLLILSLIAPKFLR